MAMKMEKKCAGTRNAIAAGVSLSLLAMVGNGPSAKAQGSAETNAEKQTVTQSKFYCNIKALGPAERASHKRLTDKLMAVRKETVESEKGYEFQYSPKDVSLAELAEWVVAEGKCCPFFDFHIDLEREGDLLCLRLTGAEGIKAFIRAELPMGTK
jgi:hypothetical protein